MTIDRRKFLQTSAGAASMSLLGLDAAREASAGSRSTRCVSARLQFGVGAIKVTAIADGIRPVGLELFPHAVRDEARQLLAAENRPEHAPAAITAYVVQTGDMLILVDTGYGNIAGPDTGHLSDDLSNAGFKPSDFDAVVLSHLHPDHMGGLLDRAGRPVFEKATLLVAREELAFWESDGAESRASAERRKFFHMARAATKPYKDRLQLFEGGDDLAPGVLALAAPGHTPGHTAIMVACGKDSLLIWGDMIHSATLQLARPEWSTKHDCDAALAAQTRMKLLDRLAVDNIIVAGPHLDFPGIGYVSRKGRRYEFEPRAVAGV